jgi:hypothetical protein
VREKTKGRPSHRKQSASTSQINPPRQLHASRLPVRPQAQTSRR